uniref:Peptidase S1 domain-containing protein n=1 Tax=Sander lucioperca TaxID=283035 RepID=A0A8C9ZIM7_SANLU
MTYSSSLQHVKLGSAIIDGKKAPEKSMLYMASVQNENGQHVCGGFLVSNNFVVTAAHCDEKRKNKENSEYIEKICQHPSYNSNIRENDILLGGMDNTFYKGQPIQLPTSEININEKCSVAGWGNTECNIVGELRVVDVSIINRDVCKKEWSNLPVNVICAGKGLYISCSQGDLGGPLVCDGTAVGVASFYKNKDCDTPNVYTDISKSLTWINKVLKQNDC